MNGIKNTDKGKIATEKTPALQQEDRNIQCQWVKYIADGTRQE